jgi:hypothetical protein
MYVKIECDRHLDHLVAQFCLGYRWYVGPVSGTPKLREPETVDCHFTPFQVPCDSEPHLVFVDWHQPNSMVPRFSTAPHLVFDLLLGAMREKGFYCIMHDRAFSRADRNPYWAGFQCLDTSPAMDPLDGPPYSATSNRSLADAIQRAALLSFGIEATW